MRLVILSRLFIPTKDRQSLHNKRVLALDLSAIMAGSGIRGAVEEKFKALIRDIEDGVTSATILDTAFVFTNPHF